MAYTVVRVHGGRETAHHVRSMRKERTMYWILQSNPKRFNITANILDRQPIPCWTASPSSRVESVRPGDGVAIWVSGDSAGVYGVGIVNGNPYPGFTSSEPDGWVNEEDRGVPKMLIPVSFSYLQKPVLRSELKVDKRFENSLILRMPGGPNPFPLTKSEWNCIKRHTLTSNPEQADWLEWLG